MYKRTYLIFSIIIILYFNYGLHKKSILKNINQNLNSIHDLRRADLLSRELLVHQQETLTDLQEKANTLLKLEINKV